MFDAWFVFIVFFKQKTAYEMRISDWSSDVCSSDLFWLPPEGCSYRVAVVSMKKAYPGHAKRVMMGVWSYLRQFMYTKWVIVVDHTVDARDWKQVVWAISTKMDPARDITLVESTPIDYREIGRASCRERVCQYG